MFAYGISYYMIYRLCTCAHRAGEYRGIMALCRLLPGGSQAKQTVDGAIAAVQPMGNILADIRQCKVGRGRGVGGGQQRLLSERPSCARGTLLLCVLRPCTCASVDISARFIIFTEVPKCHCFGTNANTARARRRLPTPRPPRCCWRTPRPSSTRRTRRRGSWACTTSSATSCSSCTGGGRAARVCVRACRSTPNALGAGGTWGGGAGGGADGPLLLLAWLLGQGQAPRPALCVCCVQTAAAPHTRRVRRCYLEAGGSCEYGFDRWMQGRRELAHLFNLLSSEI